MLACDRPCSSGRSAGAYTILPGASLREAKPHRAGGQLLASRPNDQCLRTLRGTLVFEDKKAADGDAYTVIKNTPELIREIPYELSIPYHPWMKNAALILVGELDNYEGAPLRTFVNVLTEHLDIP